MTYVYLYIVTILAYFVKGMTGFGNTVIMAPLFSFLLAPGVTTPIDLLFSIPTNLYLTYKNRKGIQLKIVLPIVLLILLGNIPGALLLKGVNEQYLRIVLGLVIIGIGLDMFLRQRKATSVGKRNTKTLVFLGLLSGTLAGMFGIALPVVAYINRTTRHKDQFKGNLCLVFLCDNLFRAIFYRSLGILNGTVLKIALILSPAVIVSLWLGQRIETHIKETTMQKFIILLLIISGGALVVRNLL